jgi:hypothetical protein
MGEPIILDWMGNEVEREAATKFVTNALRKWYQCDPTLLPDDVIVARVGNEIVGTLAVFFRKGEESLSLENIWQFDYGQFNLNKENAMQFGRLIATVDGVSRPLLYASAMSGINRGFTHGIAEVKPRVAEVLSEIGVIMYYPATVLHSENIPEPIRPYYETPPMPNLCIVNLAQKAELLKGDILKAISAGKLVLNLF